MGRHKQHKPRRPRGESGQPTTEWFGTAFHSTEGMQHLDVRRSGNGILITSSPAEIDGVPASWPLRLRNDVDGGLNEVGAALAAGRGPRGRARPRLRRDRGPWTQDRSGVHARPPRGRRRHAGPGPHPR